jgi:hypothetical protein
MALFDSSYERFVSTRSDERTVACRVKKADQRMAVTEQVSKLCVAVSDGELMPWFDVHEPPFVGNNRTAIGSIQTQIVRLID